MSSFENSKVPWSKLTSGSSSLSAPGPPHMQDNQCVNEKRKDNIPRKLEKKLREFGGSDSSGTSDSDAKDVGYIIIIIINTTEIKNNYYGLVFVNYRAAFVCCYNYFCYYYIILYLLLVLVMNGTL